MESKFIDIRTLKITDEPNKKIIISINPLMRLIRFQGQYKSKLYSNRWETLSSLEINTIDDEMLKFEDAIKMVHDSLNESIEFLELSAAYLTDVDEISFNVLKL